MTRSLQVLIVASRFALAAAIVYFAWQLALINDKIPAITGSVDQVSQQIEPVLAEVREIRQEIHQLQSLVPPILTEVGAVRQQIPAVVAEVAQVRQQIPHILTEVAQVRAQIPPLLATADQAIIALNTTRDDVVPLVPLALDEIRLTRESIEPTLDRVEYMVDDAFSKADSAILSAGDAGKKASEGAVSGFFTGLIKLPFQLVGTLASPVVKSVDADVLKQLDEKDIELIAEAANRAVDASGRSEEQYWENPQSGKSGSIHVLRNFESRGFECLEARIVIRHKSRQLSDETNQFCKNAEDRWVPSKNISD